VQGMKDATVVLTQQEISRSVTKNNGPATRSDGRKYRLSISTLTCMQAKLRLSAGHMLIHQFRLDLVRDFDNSIIDMQTKLRLTKRQKEQLAVQGKKNATVLLMQHEGCSSIASALQVYSLSKSPS